MKKYLSALLFLLFSSNLVWAEGAIAILKKWKVFEVSLRAKNLYKNPYAEIPGNEKDNLVQVVFSGVKGEAKGKTITIAGFWDGGKNWKVRFAPPFAGTWKFESKSSDPGMNKKKGYFEVSNWSADSLIANPTRRGFVQVMKSGEQAGRFFQYADGSPFLGVGDTWWNWTKRGIKFPTYKTMVDDRAAKGFNIGQLFVAANGWGRSSSLLDSTYSILDVVHMQKVDSMIAYANSKGITVWVHGWWSRKDLNKTAGEEKMKRWWRYLIHRLGAYNVVWVLAGEYNLDNYGGLGLPFWKDLGRMLKDEDPYNRIVGVHNTPPYWSGGADAPQWSTAEILHNEKWLDYNQSQVGHGRVANEMIPDVVDKAYKMKPAKPIVVTEPWYEFVEGNPIGRDIRFGSWSAILSGAAGHTYGGGHVWLAHVPEAPAGTGGPWPLEQGFERNTLNYEGAVSIGHLSRFFKDIPWWKMSPHPELVLEYPDKYCLAIPEEEYIVYLRWGGTLKLNLSKSSQKDKFEFYFFNPRTGKTNSGGVINGGAIRFFSAPGSYPGTLNFKDWVLHVRKK